MKNYQFSTKQLGILVVVIVALSSLSLVFYFEESQTVISCLCPAVFNGTESIAFYSFHVNSPANVTITLGNAGTVNSALAEYFVKDSNGDTYSDSTWAGPALSPQQTATVNILLSGNLSGQPLQIQSGRTYIVTIVTARNNPFTYTFTT